MNEQQLPLFDRVLGTCDVLRERTGCRPRVGFVLGSGLGAFAGSVDDRQAVSYEALEHMPRSTVPGHSGNFVFGRVAGIEVAVMAGRAHYYEGHDLGDLTIGVRTLVALGCEAVVVTNAAGGIRPEFQPGDLMCLADHMNLQWQSPLRGPHDPRLGVRFLDMSQAYDPALREQLHVAAEALGIRLHDGVYAALTGPTYETPAEVRMLGILGADAIGMSTVYEVVAARHAGARVVGISLISNLAAGIQKTALSHAEVTETAAAVAGSTVQLLRDFVPLAAAVLDRAK